MTVKKACEDGLDNDRDDLVDTVDPGCASTEDDNEGDETCVAASVLAYALQPAGTGASYETEPTAVTQLRAQGFNVEFKNRVTLPNLTVSVLSQYKVVWLWNGRGGGGGLSGDELQALRTRYLGGGSLILSADDDGIGTGATGSAQERVNAVAEMLGVSFEGHTTGDPSCVQVNKVHDLFSLVGLLRRDADAVLSLSGSVAWGSTPPVIAGKDVASGLSIYAVTPPASGHGGVAFDPSFTTLTDTCVGGAQLRRNVLGFFGYKPACGASSSASSFVPSSSISSSTSSIGLGGSSSSSHVSSVTIQFTSSARFSSSPPGNDGTFFLYANGGTVTAIPEGCGDGIVNGGEQCDHGARNGTGRDICAADCTFAPDCGNGIVERGEECDHGGANGVSGNTCSNLCRFVPVCGNGTLDGNEDCDDGNTVSGDGCSASCSLEGGAQHVARCGDGIVERGEQCDHGAANGAEGDACSGSCRFIPACGNARLDAGEVCDDGNLRDGDGCSASCAIEVQYYPRCGNGQLDPGEVCDDSNLRDGDGCSVVCVLEASVTAPFCGDGIIEVGEECDDGSSNSAVTPDACRPKCLLPVCGDGIVDSGEQCDAGKENGTLLSFCNPSCRRPVLATATGTSIAAGVSHGAPSAALGSVTEGSTVTISWPHGPEGSTGPVTVVIMAAGAAAGWAWVRRRRK